MSKTLKLMILSLAFFASGCAWFAGEYVGDFCDLGIQMKTDDEVLARTIAERDIGLIVDMNVNNKLLDRCPNSEA